MKILSAVDPSVLYVDWHKGKTAPIFIKFFQAIIRRKFFFIELRRVVGRMLSIFFCSWGFGIGMIISWLISVGDLWLVGLSRSFELPNLMLPFRSLFRNSIKSFMFYMAYNFVPFFLVSSQVVMCLALFLTKAFMRLLAAFNFFT